MNILNLSIKKRPTGQKPYYLILFCALIFFNLRQFLFGLLTTSYCLKKGLAIQQTQNQKRRKRTSFTFFSILESTSVTSARTNFSPVSFS